MKYAINVVRQMVIFVALLSSSVVFAIPDIQQNASINHSESAAKNKSVVNINTADAQTITSARLKGIGKKRAEAIVAFRSQHGPFKSMDDLKNIKGISENTINANRNRLTLS